MSLAPKLSYVALISRDVPAAAKVLGDVLGLARTECSIEKRSIPVFAVGDASLALFESGDPFVQGEERAGLHHIGLTVADLDEASKELQRTGISVSNATAGFAETRRVALDPQGTVGVRTFLVEPFKIKRSSSRWIERIDHLGIASASNQDAITAFTGKIGLPTESQQTDMEIETAIESFTSDKYGVVYHSRSPRVLGGLRVAFLTAGDCELEFLQNFDPSHGAEISHGASGNTRQDQGAITRYIETRGQGLHHIALKSPDINGTLTALGEAGCTMIDLKGRPGSRRALIGFIHPRTFGGVLFHVVQRD
jgi:catechol 2,3-dioxygenase-like lactoylglutathione lyase family enzyme